MEMFYSTSIINAESNKVIQTYSVFEQNPYNNNRMFYKF